MEPSFNIQTQDVDNAQLHVLVEAGPQGLSFVAANMESRTIIHCVAWHFAAGMEPNAAATELAKLFDTEPLLRQTYKKAELIYSFDECILVPHEVYPSIQQREMMEQMYGDVNEGVVRSDFVYKHNLHTVYRLPMTATRLSIKADSTTNSHQMAALLNTFEASEGMWVIFFNGSVSIMLRNNDRLLLGQHFAYSVPEDVAWHLLAVCKQFNLSPQELPLILFGLIDEQSAMYAELHKYFLNIRFADGGQSGLEWPEALPSQPPHYFAHLFTALSCV